ncbi:dioxygenase [Acetobacter oeni]|uniref:Dioxygenase n=2 Tax=Acetobacter oeni TaxID=304077 RepID=A0A511XK07_9PROT|nr:aromatic ring-opening dioxygenase catalytic subunit LigB [Acetobacter oeni LMG 21952]GEN63285.1 dioxygenase [Acetobacter oeni]
MDQSGTWEGMAAYLRGIAATLPACPDAILVMSGHWETVIPAVTSGENPALIYDYYGFPEHTYRLTYPVPGSPALATEVRALLTAADIPCALDPERGLDHGVFIPFMLAFDKAAIPVVELSLQQDLNPAAELRAGAALEPLRNKNILIVATGMTYHNLRHFMGRNTVSDAQSRAFDAWLTAAVEAPASERNQALRDWENAPGARACHPREEHLLPLMFAAGAAGNDAGQRDYSEAVMGKVLSGFRFG